MDLSIPEVGDFNIFNSLIDTDDLQTIKVLFANAHVYWLNRCLCTMSWRGNTEIVQWLIESGADVNYSNDYPILTAVSGGQLSTVKLLLNYGASVNYVGDGAWNENGGDSFYVAADRGHYDILKLLLENCLPEFIHANFKSATLAATHSKHKDIIDLLNTYK